MRIIVPKNTTHTHKKPRFRKEKKKHEEDKDLLAVLHNEGIVEEGEIVKSKQKKLFNKEITTNFVSPADGFSLIEEKIRNPNFYQSYQRSGRLIDLAMRHLKLHIDVDIHDPLLREGDIFVFNHFARFETLIPPYLIFKKIGAYSRTIATRELFNMGLFSDFLCSVGSVPDNLPDLMLFLGIEILKGRKVVIFPEGSMIKDKYVSDDEGNLGIFSQSHKKRRKLHKGAAVLSLGVYLLKEYLLMLEDKGRHDLLDDFVARYEYDSKESLLERCRKQTKIVPGNITFFPLRGTDNSISRFSEKLFKIKGRYLEEVIVETNFLFRDTDMNVRCYDPIVIDDYIKKVDHVMVAWHLRRAEPEMFFRRQTETLTDKIFDRWFQGQTENIRDVYAKKIYEGLTVNIYHIVSYFILKFLKEGVDQVPVSQFLRLVYIAIKTVVNSGRSYIHPHLLDPYYYGILWGVWTEGGEYQNITYDTIFEHEGRPLLKRQKNMFVFDKKILTYTDFSSIRLQNPVRVYANEILPVRSVIRILKGVFRTYQSFAPESLMDMYVSDEKRAYEKDFAIFHQRKYEVINKKQTYIEPGQPYLLRSKKTLRWHKDDDQQIGVIVAHGFLASPAEVRPLADFLQDRGYTVYAPRLTGHGTSPHDLARCTYEDWLLSIRRAVTLMKSCYKRVVIVGFSMGGTLGLLHAARYGGVAGVIPVSSPVFVRDKKLRFVGALSKLQKAFRFLPLVSEEASSFYENKPENPHINYCDMPLHALDEFRKMLECVKNEVKEVTCPVFSIQGDEDPVVDPKSAQFIYDNVASNKTDKEIAWVKSSIHGIVYHNTSNVHDMILEKIKAWQYAITP